MDLELTDDQKLFHETTVRFIESELPLTSTRELHDDPRGFDPDWLSQGASLGWFAMLVPEGDGGGSVSGSGLLDAVIVAEEMGRHVQPGPFISMNVVAGALVEDGTTEQREQLLPAIVGADTVATWAVTDAVGNWDSGAGLVATPDGDGYGLSGVRSFVLDAQSAEHLLTVASVDGEPAQFLVPAGADGVTITPLECLDLSRRMAEVSYDGVFVPVTALVGEIGNETALQRQLQVAIALTSAETVGALDAMFSMTVDYAKDRIAFGRPIGSFQSLKHIMADLALYLEGCKAAAVAAARAVEARTDDSAEVVSMVASYIGEKATEIAQQCLQIHGGIGYTWEHDLHLYMRRTRSNTALFGEPTWHRELVCSIHGL